MQVAPLTPELAREYELPRSVKGVVVTDVDPDGVAAESGVQPSDVIEKVNGRSTATVAELKTAIERTDGKPVLMLVNRQGRSLFLTLRLGGSYRSLHHRPVRHARFTPVRCRGGPGSFGPWLLVLRAPILSSGLGLSRCGRGPADQGRSKISGPD